MQEERESEVMKPIANWKSIVSKVKEKYLLEDYEIQLHKQRQNLKQRDKDVAMHIDEFHKLCFRSSMQEIEGIKVAR